MREADFIVSSSCPYQTADIAARLDHCLSGPIDWAFVEREAIRHGVLSLMYANLQRRSGIPEYVLDRFGAAARSGTRVNLALAAELFKVVQVFRDAGVAVLPFKGPVLAAAVYGSLTFRSFCDLDLLVRPAELSKARELLASLGYRPAFDLDRHGEKAYFRSEHALPMHNSDNGIDLDLHWRLTQRNFLRSIATDELLSRQAMVKVAGYSIPCLGLEDLLLYLCVHGAKDDWRKLEWLCSMAKLIQINPSLNWNLVLNQAERTGTRRALRLGLLLAKDLFELELPAEVMAFAGGDSIARTLVLQVKGNMFQRVNEGRVFDRARRGIFLLRVSDSFFDRLRIVFFSVFRIPHPEAKELLLLPRSWSFVYYVLRPVRLVVSCIKGALPSRSKIMSNH